MGSDPRVIIVDTRNANDYERERIREIASWKGAAPRTAAKWIGRAAAPIDSAIRAALTEDRIDQAFAEANRLASRTLSSASLTPPESLEAADREARSARNWAVGAAAAGGAGAGATGVVGLVADIPFTVTLALRAIRRIGAAYGYADESEAAFAARALAAACANSRDEKDAALRALDERESDDGAPRSVSRSAMAKPGAVYASRGLVAALVRNLAGRKVAQVVPVVGAAVGAVASASFLEDVCTAAQRLYQERFLRDREILDSPIL